MNAGVPKALSRAAPVFWVTAYRRWYLGSDAVWGYHHGAFSAGCCWALMTIAITAWSYESRDHDGRRGHYRHREAVAARSGTGAPRGRGFDLRGIVFAFQISLSC